jgi:SAM-dependent methyltransferase
MEKQWYESWFDSPFYHVLYKKRDEREARLFIDTLIYFLDPKPNARMLDLACGKGRFSRFLAGKGYDVTGLDLSVNNIEFARQYETDNLSFFTQDMRKVFRVNYFDFIFSFFTSFGYFESEKEDLQSLQSISTGLKKNGIFVLDFFNANYVIEHLVAEEVKKIDNISFNIRRWIEASYVFKTIQFVVEGKEHFYQERVRLFKMEELENLLKMTDMRIEKVFGDYFLADFDLELSPRMILVIKKY